MGISKNSSHADMTVLFPSRYKILSRRVNYACGFMFSLKKKFLAFCRTLSM